MITHPNPDHGVRVERLSVWAASLMKRCAGSTKSDRRTVTEAVRARQAAFRAETNGATSRHGVTARL